MPKHANIHHQITFQCQAVPNHNNYLAKTRAAKPTYRIDYIY